ncbi:MerR family transcriptional regulator [Lactobacillus sp. ESL0791]|uniref:MerR family transcriptional regulator n=1 Tax=Lactobacillus sp. ESL0791 TaxID=2983234 RepID=UPI0023F795DA|nr:MerR family transcriptional regulator [Lactobacillus sp. ESL0791]MDF7639038.1 MerR family transcriptional regulator [Lactobacillus sp. ESL0791]
MSKKSYSSKKVQDLTGLTVCTLRYYDKLGLLHPVRQPESNYRLYSEDDLDAIQQIMIFKEMGFKLKTIKKILTEPTFDLDHALALQLKLLTKQKSNLEDLITNVKQTIKMRKGEEKMDDTKKFASLKKAVANNEKLYGRESRQKYGAEVIEKSNEQLSKMTEAKFNELKEIETQLVNHLQSVLKNPEKEPELGYEIFSEHQQWLRIIMPNYSLKIHLGIITAYENDSRYQDYYDEKAGNGATRLLVKIVKENLEKEKI